MPKVKRHKINNEQKNTFHLHEFMHILVTEWKEQGRGLEFYPVVHPKQIHTINDTKRLKYSSKRKTKTTILISNADRILNLEVTHFVVVPNSQCFGILIFRLYIFGLPKWNWQHERITAQFCGEIFHKTHCKCWPNERVWQHFCHCNIKNSTDFLDFLIGCVIDCFRCWTFRS